MDFYLVYSGGAYHQTTVLVYSAHLLSSGREAFRTAGSDQNAEMFLKYSFKTQTVWRD